MHAGHTARLTFSLAYSPPEMIAAVEAGAVTVTADAAADMWAIGVIAYELALLHPAFTPLLWPRDAVQDAAAGRRPFPWEVAVGSFAHIPELRALGRDIRACLSRTPEHRPTAAAFLASLNHLFDVQGA
jgi:serine/threonine protein kinase